MNNNIKLYDLDHVLLLDERIFRVLGNLYNEEKFWGYNVYSPNKEGDRIFNGKKYIKNFIEDEKLPDDVLDTYNVIYKKNILRHFDPIRSTQENCESFKNSIWFSLYKKLKEIFGKDSVGIFGSSMFNLHLTKEGNVGKDVDFVIQGLENIDKLKKYLPSIREELGFTEVSKKRQYRQYQRYLRVFHNKNNTIKEIIKRRWTGLQLSEDVVSTIRFRDKKILTPFELIDSNNIVEKNFCVSGKVTNANLSNLFPRMFTIEARSNSYPVYLFWWKFSTPVREDDNITLCGDLMKLRGQNIVRVTNYRNHWLRITA